MSSGKRTVSRSTKLMGEKRLNLFALPEFRLLDTVFQPFYFLVNICYNWSKQYVSRSSNYAQSQSLLSELDRIGCPVSDRSDRTTASRSNVFDTSRVKKRRSGPFRPLVRGLRSKIRTFSRAKNATIKLIGFERSELDFVWATRAVP